MRHIVKIRGKMTELWLAETNVFFFVLIFFSVKNLLNMMGTQVARQRGRKLLCYCFATRDNWQWVYLSVITLKERVHRKWRSWKPTEKKIKGNGQFYLCVIDHLPIWYKKTAMGKTTKTTNGTIIVWIGPLSWDHRSL